jgi:hypothetical protein
MIPTAPNGATVDSLLLASSRLDESHSPNGASRRFYQSRHPRANPFARHASMLSATAFAGLISPEQLILNHSAWPVYSCLISRRSAHAWFQRTRDGVGNPAVPEVHAPVSSELSTSRWRSCRSCVDLHRNKFGTGHWMVIHQLPGIGVCPNHGEPLDLECGVCGAALGGQSMNRLPGEPCSKCGARTAKRTHVRASAGERQLARLYANLLGGQAMDLDVSSRELLMRNASRVLSKSQPDTSIEQLVLSEFNCQDAEELGRHIKAAVTPNLLRLAAAGTSANSVPASLHLAVLGVAIARLEDEGYLDERRLLSVDLPCVDEGALYASDLPTEFLEELLSRASDYNISTVAVMARLSGLSVRFIEQQGFASATRLKQFTLSLPEHLAKLLPTLGKALQPIVRRGATQEEHRSANRHHIQQMVDSGVRNRALLLLNCGTSYKWALKFDRDWLDGILPAWGRSKRG